MTMSKNCYYAFLLALSISVVSCARNSFRHGTFELDANKSKALSAVPDGLLTVQFTEGGSLLIQPFGIQGTWSASDGELVLTVDKPNELFNTYESRQPSDSTPLRFNWKINNDDELAWQPKSFSGKQNFVLVFSRRN